MKELIRTNDVVLVSWLQTLLGDDGIQLFVLDAGMSVLEGSAGAIPRRLMVADDEFDRACRLVRDAGAGQHLGD